MKYLSVIPAPPAADGRTGPGALCPAGEEAEGRAVSFGVIRRLSRGEVRL